MTIHTLAADLADRVPEMARDSKTNNAELIERMLLQSQLFFAPTCSASDPELFAATTPD